MRGQYTRTTGGPSRACDVRLLTYLVKVEREVAGDGAIETRLQE